MLIIKDDWLEKLLTVVDMSDFHVLEIGCGRGDTTRLLAQVCESVVAVDSMTRVIQNAKACNNFPNIEYQRSNAVSLPFGDVVFDAAIFSFSFHHISHKKHQTAINEALRVLKDRGYLIFLEPGFCGTLCQFERLFGAGDGEERIAKLQAYASICRLPYSMEVIELCAEKQIKFEVVEEIIDLLKPKKGSRSELKLFLEKNNFLLNADRRLNIFRKSN